MDVEQQGRRQPFASERDARPDGAGWSPRARRLIEETHALCVSWLEAPLRACLTDTEQRLYAQAERSRNNLEQQRSLYSRQLLQQQRGTLERLFLQGLREQFSRLGASAEATEEHDAPRRPLALLDQGEHEQTVAVQTLVARGEARHGPALFELGYRVAVLVSQPPLEGDDLVNFERAQKVRPDGRRGGGVGRTGGGHGRSTF